MEPIRCIYEPNTRVLHFLRPEEVVPEGWVLLHLVGEVVSEPE